MAKEKIYVSQEVFDSLISLRDKFDSKRDYVHLAISNFEPYSFIQSISGELIIAKFLNDEIDIEVPEKSYYWYSKLRNKYIGPEFFGGDYQLIDSKLKKYTESELKANTLYDLSKFEKQQEK